MAYFLAVENRTSEQREEFDAWLEEPVSAGTPRKRDLAALAAYGEVVTV